MGGITGSTQKKIAMQQAAQQNALLAEQRADAQNAQVGALQPVLEADTNRLLRTFGTRVLLAGSRGAN